MPSKTRRKNAKEKKRARGVATTDATPCTQVTLVFGAQASIAYTTDELNVVYPLPEDFTHQVHPMSKNRSMVMVYKDGALFQHLIVPDDALEIVPDFFDDEEE